jgi:flagellar protein FliS
MWQNAHDSYMESRVLSADPIELVKMLYQAAVSEVRDARRHLANRDIVQRARAISKANAIVTELAVSLDHEHGGEVSRGLARLYDYMGRRLIEANFQQADRPLDEVLKLLLTLAEGWEGMPAALKPEARPESPWAQSLPQAPLPEAIPTYESHAWSF